MNPYLSACATRSVHLLGFVVVLLLSLQSLRGQSLEELWTVEVGPFGHDVWAVEFFPDGEKFAVARVAPANIVETGRAPSLPKTWYAKL